MDSLLNGNYITFTYMLIFLSNLCVVLVAICSGITKKRGVLWLRCRRCLWLIENIVVCGSVKRLGC